MTHRIREAMAGGSFKTPMGGAGKIVEVDETFIGRKKGVEKRRGAAHKNVVLSLVERGGSARSFHVNSTKKEDIIPIVKANIAKETHVMTDELNTYSGLDKLFDKATMWSITPARNMPTLIASTENQHRYQWRGRLLLRFQARHERHLSALRGEAPSPLSIRVRFPALEPHRPWRGGRRARRQNHSRSQRQTLGVSTA